MAALLAVAAVTASCADLQGAGSQPDSPSPSASPAPTQPGSTAAPQIAADLTITLDETGQSSVTTVALTCDPPGGDHPDPRAACAALADAGGAAAMEPVPRDAVCTEEYGGPQTAVVQGTIAGEQVRATFSRTDGCEISRWDALAPLLGTPGGV